MPIALNQIPAPNVTLGPLVVTMEVATLPDLMGAIGRGAMRPNGLHAHDGGGDEVCFSYSGNVIRFVSNTEMGGSKRAITDFVVESPGSELDECPMLPVRFTPIRVGGWLQIGDDRATVEQHMGTMAGRDDAQVLYRFSGATPGHCSNVDFRGFDIGASLQITYRGNAVIRIKGSQVTSC